jgi:hypothetical protein
VLQVSHQDPVVRSALIAVGSVHRGFVTEEKSVGFVNPLEEYDKALRRLRRYIASEKPPDMKVMLVRCALLYCFDTTRGE